MNFEIRSPDQKFQQYEVMNIYLLRFEFDQIQNQRENNDCVTNLILQKISKITVRYTSMYQNGKLFTM